MKLNFIRNGGILLPILLVAVAYAVVGRLGLQWSILSGYASIVWPSSGIALAGILLAGYRAWPGVFLGSLLVNVNFQLLLHPQDIDAVLIQVAIWLTIATGAAVQALVSAYLLHRYARFPNTLTHWKDLILFFALAGPVGCLIGASVGTTALMIGGTVLKSAWPEVWGTWWLGDILGVFVFTPLILVWWMKPRELWSQRRVVVSLLLLVTFTLAVAVFNLGQRFDEQRIHSAFKEKADDLARVFQLRMEQPLAVLTHINAFHNVYGELTLEAYREYVDILLKENPSIQALGWNPRFQHTQREEIEQALRLNYGPDAKITERDSRGEIVPALVRNEYVAVLFIEKLDENIKALGFDVLSNAIRRKALDTARDTGLTVVTGRISLVQGTDNQYGVLIFHPHFSRGFTRGDSTTPGDHLTGYHTAVFSIGNMVNTMLAERLPEGVLLRLYDRSSDPGEQLLYATSLHGLQLKAGSHRELKQLSDRAVTFSYQIPLAMRQWELQVVAEPHYLNTQIAKVGWLIFVIGLLVTSLMGVLSLMITGRKVELESTVQQRTRELERSSLAKSAFLANMSHDLRTPLNAILGFSEYLSHDPDISADQMEKIGIINRSGEHLLTMINEILNFSRVEAGRAELQPSVFDLLQMLEDIRRTFEALAKKSAIGFKLEIDPSLNQYIETDYSKLRQILNNLLSNAIKFTTKGSVSLRVSMQPTSGDPAWVTLQLEVKDTGSGITPEQLERIFEPFVQIARHASNEPGSGLGLAITRKLVDLMDGEIKVESQPGKGSLFRVELPVKQSDADELENIQVKQSAVFRLEAGQATCRILIVDDNRDNLSLLSSLLTEAGFEIFEAKNGEEAIEMFQQCKPMFIWMDMRMPVMDGFEATARIRALPGGDEVKIAAITASVFEDQRDKILAAGCDDVVFKPYQTHEVFDVMHQLLGVRYVNEVADRKITGQVEIDLNSESLAQLPAELLQSLNQAVRRLDIEATNRVIEQIRDNNSGIADQLQALAGNYLFGRIAEILNKTV